MEIESNAISYWVLGKLCVKVDIPQMMTEGVKGPLNEHAFCGMNTLYPIVSIKPFNTQRIFAKPSLAV